ncbi:MAG: DUF222 domain-containing protein [Actinomycetes bacterium]
MSTPTHDIADRVAAAIDAVPLIGVLTDAGLRDEVIACERAAQQLLARQAQAMVEMARRAEAADAAEAQTQGQPQWSSQTRIEFIVDEIAALLTCTKVAASHRYAAAWAAADHPALGGAWQRGRLDARKVEIIATQVHLLGNADAAALADSSVDYAMTHTGPQIREWLRRRVIAIDPAAAEAQRQHALADRRVVITPRDDGTAELWALLPSINARHIQQILTKVAHDAASGDPRTTDQRRADALVELVTGGISAPPVAVQVVVPVDTLAGHDDAPGWFPGWAPATADEVRQTCGQAGPPADPAQPQLTLSRLLADPATGSLVAISEKRYRPSAALDRAVRARDVTCRFPGCRRAASAPGTDLDHTVPWPAGPTSADNLAVLCRHHHRLKHSPGWAVALDAHGAMTWTSPTGHAFTTTPWKYLEPRPPQEGGPDPPLE